MTRALSDATLGALVEDAIRLRDRMKADGMSGEQLEAAFEQTIREIWRAKAFTREWHYLCALCEDTGLRVFTCRPGRRCDGRSMRLDGPKEKPGKYPRLCKLHAESEYEHDYAEPCVCDRGQRFLDKPKEASDFMDAGKTPKAKPARFGR